MFKIGIPLQRIKHLIVGNNFAQFFSIDYSHKYPILAGAMRCQASAQQFNDNLSKFFNLSFKIPFLNCAA